MRVADVSVQLYNRLRPILATFQGKQFNCHSDGQAVVKDIACTGSRPMFPLSGARVRTHTARETSAHKKPWGADTFPFQKGFCTYFIHVIPNSGEFR